MVLKTRICKVTKNSRIISSVGASMACEGLKPSAHAEKIGKQYLEGKINSDEAIAKIKQMHAAKFGS